MNVGDTSEAKALGFLLEEGYQVAIPYGTGHHYDLIALIDGWKTIQVKTGRLLETGSIRFRVASATRTGEVGYQGDRGVDYFAVYCPELPDRIYLIPSDKLNQKVKAYIRVYPAKNNQNEKILLAEEFKVPSG